MRLLVLFVFLSSLALDGTSLQNEGHTFNKQEYLNLPYLEGRAMLNDSIRVYENKRDFESAIRLRVILGELYIAFGEFDSADSLLMKNAADIKDLFATDSKLYADNDVAYSRMYQILERWNDFKQAIDRSVKIKRNLELGEDYFIEDYSQYVWYYQSTQKFDSAYYYGKLAVELSKNTARENRPYLLAEAYNNLGYTYHYDFETAVSENNLFDLYADSTLRVLGDQPIKDNLTLARLYHNYGNYLIHNKGVYNQQKTSKGFEYYDKSLDLYRNYNNPYFISLNYFVRGYAYYVMSFSVPDKEIDNWISKSFDMYSKSLEALSLPEATIDESHPPLSLSSKIPNFYISIVAKFSNTLYRYSQDKRTLHELKNAFKYYQYYYQLLEHYLNENVEETNDLVVLASHEHFWNLNHIINLGVQLDSILDSETFVSEAYYLACSKKNFSSKRYLKLNQFHSGKVFIDSLQRSLGIKNSVLIDYYTGGLNSYAILISSDSFKTIKINSDIVPKIHQDNNLLRLPIEEYNRVSYEIFSKILKPVIQELPPDVSDIVICPSSFIDRLPFDGLAMSEDIRPSYVISDYNITYDLSPDIWLSRNSGDKKLIKDMLLVEPSFRNQPSLPFSSKLSEYLNSTYTSDLLDHDDASSQAILKKIEYADLLHISTHTKTSDTPFQYEFITSDGGIKYEDLNKLDLANIDLAVLHGCKSNYGQYVMGLTSLGREFMKLGAKSTVLTIWDVDDFYSSELLKKFYEYLDTGLPPSKSLRAAKLYMMLDSPHEAYAHPANWAGLVHYGEDNPLELSRRINYYWLLAVLLIPVIIILARNKFQARQMPNYSNAGLKE